MLNLAHTLLRPLINIVLIANKEDALSEKAREGSVYGVMSCVFFL